MEVMDLEPAQNENDDSMEDCCWQRSKTLKIVLACIPVILIIGTGIIIYIYGAPMSDSKKNAEIGELELQNLAAYYTQSLDQNSPPCEDFYAFACGNLRKQYKTENKSRFDTMSMMEKRARDSLDEFLTKPLTTSDSAMLRQTKLFHQLCINETKVETEGIDPVLTLLNQIGGWPLLTSNSENSESWEKVVEIVNRAGFAIAFPFDLASYIGPTNSSKTTIMLKPLLYPNGLRVLPNEKRTTDYVKRIASLLNATNDHIDDDIKNCIDFESKLEELTNSLPVDRQEHTLESLRTDYPEFAWETFFRSVFVATGLEVSSSETVFLSESTYNIDVSELLNKTPAKIIRNYIIWRLIVKAIPLMPEKFREAKNVFEQRTVGQSRNLDCLDTLINNAKVSIGYLYIKKLFDGLAKNMAHGILKNIESQAYRFLKNNSWMDDDTKKKLIETLRSTEMLVPHPDDNIDAMETLEFESNDTMFENYRLLTEAHRNFKYGRLRVPLDVYRRSILFEYATTADAMYHPLMNTSFMLPAIFQRPFFSASQPMYLNYGSIGFTMAHELAHALKILSACSNDECRSFDQLQERVDCMDEIYSSYVLKQLNETGGIKWTMDEDIGDLIGLKLSYRAYKEFAKNSKEQLLPGLNYTARQWFWINTATFFCSCETDEALRNYMENNAHSPYETRVNIGFANIKEFSRDFECPIGSRMNPVRKCEFQ